MKRIVQSLLPRSRRTSAANGELPDQLLPPEALQDYVGGCYHEVGALFFGYLVELCGLEPSDAVLDVGCGSGRIAVPLAGYLNHEGRYAGFDISKEAIAWCKENVSRTHPNFDFEVADIENKYYNPNGKYKSSDFRFPHSDASFDVVFLTSVFTHMLPTDVEHYMQEIARVLKSGGKCLSTFFLLNEESIRLTKAKKRTPNFKYHRQGYRTSNAKRPEAAIAYPEAFVRELYEKCGLKLEEPLRYGSWCGRTDYLTFQDVVIAVKPARRASESG